MDEKKLAVIFDTNSYRQLVNGKSLEEAIASIEKLKSYELGKDIKAFGSIIVGMEMLANLVEGDAGFNYNDCINGVTIMAKHCNDSNQNVPRVIPHVPLLAEYSLFGEVKSIALAEHAKGIGGTILDFRDSQAQAINYHTEVDTFENIKTFLDDKESEFCTQIESLLDMATRHVISENPKADKKALRNKNLELLKGEDFLIMLSKALVAAIYNNLEEPITQEELAQKAEFIRDNFPIAAGFFQQVCTDVFSKNIDLRSKSSIEKRWNWIWDYHVSYAIGNSTLDGREVILVTSDKDLKTILSNLGFSGRVMELKDYQKFLSK